MFYGSFNLTLYKIIRNIDHYYFAIIYWTVLGDVKYKPHITCKPEMRTLVLDGNEEFLVLGSDGLWEDVTPEDISEIIYDELLETDGEWRNKLYNIVQ